VLLVYDVLVIWATTAPCCGGTIAAIYRYLLRL